MSAERGWRRWRRPVGIAVAVVAIAAAAASANVVLLGSAGEDGLGRLRPVTEAAPAATAPADTDGATGAEPPGTTGAQPPATTTSGDDHGDDHGGRGRDHDEDD